jgi:hypothetical protein
MRIDGRVSATNRQDRDSVSAVYTSKESQRRTPTTLKWYYGSWLQQLILLECDPVVKEVYASIVSSLA